MQSYPKGAFSAKPPTHTHTLLWFHNTACFEYINYERALFSESMLTKKKENTSFCTYIFIFLTSCILVTLKTRNTPVCRAVAVFQTCGFISGVNAL